MNESTIKAVIAAYQALLNSDKLRFTDEIKDAIYALEDLLSAVKGISTAEVFDTLSTPLQKNGDAP